MGRAVESGGDAQIVGLSKLYGTLQESVGFRGGNEELE